jgi:hypothetical protein
MTIAGLVAIAVASRNQARQATNVSSIISEIQSLSSELTPPSSIAAELTGVPASVYSALTNPTALAALESQFVTAPPAWYTALPSDAQAWVISIAPKFVSIESQILGLEVEAGLTTLAGAAAGTGVSSSTAKATGVSNSTIASVSKGTTTTGATKAPTTAATTAAASSKAASSSSSSGGAASPTGMVAAGVMGAVGFLGFALAL